MPTCPMPKCNRPVSGALLTFIGTWRGHPAEVKVRLCAFHGERLLKHLKRFIPPRLVEVSE